MAEAATQLISVELDRHEIRSLHFAATVVQGALRGACEAHGEEIPDPPGDRTVHAGESAVMKLEAACVAYGIDLDA